MADLAKIRSDIAVDESYIRHFIRYDKQHQQFTNCNALRIISDTFKNPIK